MRVRSEITYGPQIVKAEHADIVLTLITGVSRAHLDLYRFYVLFKNFKIAALATVAIYTMLVSMALP